MTPARIAALSAVAVLAALVVAVGDGARPAPISAANGKRGPVRAPASITPFSVRIASRSGATVTLRWTTVKGGQGYMFFRDGKLLSQTSNARQTRATFPLPPRGRHLFEVKVLGKRFSARVLVGRKSAGCFSSPGSCGYPDPAYGNVGVPSGTSLTPSGSLTITRDSTVVDARNISGTVNVEANNVTIKDSRIATSGPVFAVVVTQNHSGLTIEDSEIHGIDRSTSGSIVTAVTNFGDGPVTIRGDYFYNCGDCIEYDANVTDSYILNNGGCSGCHYEDIFDGDGTIVVQHSTLFNVFPQTAVIADGVVGGPCDTHVTLNDSLVGGGGYVLYTCGNATSPGSSTASITNNRFVRCTTRPILVNVYDSGGETCTGGYPGYSGAGLPPCAAPSPGTGTCPQEPGQVPDEHGYYPRGGYFGLVAYVFCSSTTWSGNVWDDNGATVPC